MDQIPQESTIDLPTILYHHIGDDSCSYTKHLNITHHPETFRKQIKYLSENYEVVSHSNQNSCKDKKNKIRINFDDGYKSIKEIALPILREFSVPAKIFLSSTTLHHNLMWVNKLSVSGH